MWHSVGLMGLLLVLMTIPSVPVVYAAFVVAGLMILTGCISTNSARESLDWQTLITIGASFGLGHAIDRSGAASAIAGALVDTAGDSSGYVLLGALYALTGLFAAVVSSKAAGVFMYPISLAVFARLCLVPHTLAAARR